MTPVRLVLASSLFVLAVVLWLDNPTVDVLASDEGDGGAAGPVGCSIAPWDAGLNHRADPPGGEHSAAYNFEVATKCYDSNLVRFRAAVLAAALAMAFLLLTTRLRVLWAAVLGAVAGYYLLQLFAGGRHEFPNQCLGQTDGSVACTLIGYEPRSIWVDLGAAVGGAGVAALGTAGAAAAFRRRPVDRSSR